MRYTIAEIDPGRNEMGMRNNLERPLIALWLFQKLSSVTPIWLHTPIRFSRLDHVLQQRWRAAHTVTTPPMAAANCRSISWLLAPAVVSARTVDLTSLRMHRGARGAYSVIAWCKRDASVTMLQVHFWRKSGIFWALVAVVSLDHVWSLPVRGYLLQE